MHILVTLLIAVGMLSAPAKQEIKRVEPPCWWVGMETPLTLMVYGTQLAGSHVSVNSGDIVISAVHEVENPNYLFVDVKIPSDLTPGDYIFTVAPAKGKKMTFNYNFGKRREGSAQRLSFGPKDVIYLIMPDRFVNGDPTNDSTPYTVEGEGRDNISGRHGGDLQGIMNKLDYLADYGITAIWPTPILMDNEKRDSYHGYACADYYRIDPRLGTNELYRQLVADAHTKGIKFIQDMVVNHCGTAHWWYNDLPFSTWINQFDTFTRNNGVMTSQLDMHATKSDLRGFDEGWFDTTMADINLTDPYVLQYFTQWAIWWVEYADLDGLRVDTYPYSEKKSISDWTANVLREYPNLTIVGECWITDATQIAYWEGGKLNLNGEKAGAWEVKNRDGYTSHLPMVMDFHLLDNLAPAFIHNEANPPYGTGIRRVYDSFASDIAYSNPYNLMVFISNHDTPRPAYVCGGLRESEEKVLSRMKNIYTLILTTRGTPQLFYGDEIMLRSLDGTSGYSQDRMDFPGGWASDGRDAFVQNGRTPEEDAMYQHARTLLNWRKGSKAVTEGVMTHCSPLREAPNTYVYFRHTDGDMVMVVINNSVAPATLDWSRYAEMFPDGFRAGKDILTGNAVMAGEPLTVPGESSLVIQF